MSSAARISDTLNVLADPRVPAPEFNDAPVECRTRPDRWHPDKYRDVIEVRQAVNGCKRCPHSTACLLYALANPEITQRGIWAATNPYQRRELRQRLRERLGPDWIGAVTGKPAATAAD